jgi:Protein of unknown function (DUF2806)
MPDDLTPSGEGQWWQHLNLPETLLSPAGKAISRLIAGAADIPAAWLERKAKAIRDRTEAKTLVESKIAGAAADYAASDPEILDRAVQTLVATEYRKQQNRESIARQAIELLAAPIAENSKQNASSVEIDDDWLNLFASYAERASSDHMQKLWARLLAGEIRTPGTFSLRTLQFVSIADPKVAQAFHDIAPFIIDSNAMPTIPAIANLVGWKSSFFWMKLACYEELPHPWPGHSIVRESPSIRYSSVTIGVFSSTNHYPSTVQP